MTYSADNTEGYTAAEMAALNAELAERIKAAGAEPGSDEAQEIEKAFHDEVARR